MMYSRSETFTHSTAKMWSVLLCVLALVHWCPLGQALVIENEYSYWRNTALGLPELFTIDRMNDVLIVAVKNKLCRLSMDLSTELNIVDTTPEQADITFCREDFSLLQSEENCQNFHHALLLPTSDDMITNHNGSQVDIRNTVLVCGSNAFKPKCAYRNRTDLSVVRTYSGVEFSSYKKDLKAMAVITDEGHLLSGSSKDIYSSRFGIAVSTDPFNGTTQVRTIDNQNMFKSPTFVDIYDIGNFYYVFMTEPAIEITDDIIYSRVGRVCKNDSGLFESSLGLNVFTSFLKARMTCTSSGQGGPEFNYNNLKDTEYIESGTINTMVSGRHLYAAFSAPINGPVGSMLCVYTFDNGETDLNGVFYQKYLEQKNANEWEPVSNNNPVTCESGRSQMDASTFYLMKPTVVQTGDPLIKLDGMTFQKLVIDKIEGINGKEYEVILIAANEEDILKILKMTYVYNRNDDTKTHISQEIPMKSDSLNSEIITSMDLYKRGSEASLFVSTNEAIYKVSVTNCSRYSGCRSCVESRDPYCAYDTTHDQCVSTLGINGTVTGLIQDIDNGNSSKGCPIPTTSSSVVSMSIYPDITRSYTVSVSNDMSLETMSYYTTECSASVDISYVIVTSTVTEQVTPPPTVRPTTTTSQVISTTVARIPSTTTTPVISRTSSVEIPAASRGPTSAGVETGGKDNNLYMLIGISGACFLAGVAFGIVVFACLRNKDKFIWGKMLSRNRRLNFTDGEEKYCNGDYEMCQMKNDEYEKNNAHDFVKDSTPRPSTPPLSKLDPSCQPGKVTDSPVLSKYTPTGKTHNRSLSSGGLQFPLAPTLPETSCSPVPGSPVRKNIRNTYHVEEGVSNVDRQKYGKNVVSKQISREYPMTYSDEFTNHAKTNSLDLTGWKPPPLVPGR